MGGLPVRYLQSTCFLISCVWILSPHKVKRILYRSLEIVGLCQKRDSASFADFNPYSGNVVLIKNCCRVQLQDNLSLERLSSWELLLAPLAHGIRPFPKLWYSNSACSPLPLGLFLCMKWTAYIKCQADTGLNQEVAEHRRWNLCLIFPNSEFCCRFCCDQDFTQAGVSEAANFQISCCWSLGTFLAAFSSCSKSCVKYRPFCLKNKPFCQQTTNKRLGLSLLQIMCKPLVDTLVKSITAGARQHQQVRKQASKQSCIKQSIREVA